MLAAAATGLWLSTVAEDEYLAQASLLATVLAGGALVATLVLRRPVGIPFAVALLAAPYVAILGFETDGLDARAPVIAGALFLVAELAYWSLELRRGVVDEPGTYLRRAAVLAGLVLVTVTLGTAVLALVEVVSAGGLAVDLLGAFAAVGAIGLLALAAAHRPRSR